MRPTIRILALVGCAIGMSVGAAHAQQTPMQFWHQEWSRHRHTSFQQEYPYSQPRWFGEDGYGPGGDWMGDRRPRGPMPQVHVSNPTFYDYKPDALKTVSLDTLCAPAAAPPAEEAAGVVALEMIGAAATDAPSPFARACSSLSNHSLRLLPEVSAALTDWYGAHQQFVWSDGDGVGAKALAAIATLDASDTVGLDPDDYGVDPPNLDGLDDAAREAVLLQFDIVLSARALTYVLDAQRGRVDPNRISGYHDLPRKSVDLSAAMTALAGARDVAQWLEAQNPDNAQFRALVAELARLRATGQKHEARLSDDIRIVPGGSDPRLGDVLAAIAAAEPALEDRYADVFAEAPERYDRRAVAAVKAFQRMKGVHADGVIGRKTIRALMQRDDTADKIAKIEMSLERLRWLPRQFGDRYVFLNEPAFEVSYFNGSDRPLTMRAVVGRPDAQTYFFVDRIRDVQYNPYWNVPRSIVVNEMLPKLYRDGAYLDDHGYEVLNRRGRQIASNSVDWAAFAKNAASVEVRQPPGRRNALGLVKIEFPNRHAIYMHDTPQKSFFTRDMRALSHGCVRLQHPKEMAAALLGKSVGYIDRQIARGENATERVSADIPVYLAYFTAWPDRDGAVRYYADVYDRDAHLETALEKTEAARRSG